MLYAGALAAGAIAHRHPTLSGSELPFGTRAYLALASTGTFGYFFGALVGWAIGFRGGQPLLACGMRKLTPGSRRRRAAKPRINSSSQRDLSLTGAALT